MNRFLFVAAFQESTIFVLPLLRYRLRWYAASTARLLLRRWQTIILVLGLTASVGAQGLGNIETLAYPLLVLLTPDHSPIWRGGYLLLLLAFFALWAGSQRFQIQGGDFMGFIRSLPFTSRQLRHIDIAVLLLADSPLLLLIGGALASTIVHHAPAMHSMLLCDVIMLILVTQVSVLERRLIVLPFVGLACLMLAFGFDNSVGPAIALLVGGIAGLTLWLGPRCRGRHRVPEGSTQAPCTLENQSPVQGLVPFSAVIRVSLSILYRERRDEMIGKALVAGSFVAAAWALIQLFDADQRSFPTILIAQGAIALTISGAFRYLHMAHDASASYTAGLPMPRQRWRIFDMAAVISFSLPFLGGLGIAGWLVGTATGWHILWAVISYSVLLCLLSLTDLCSERHVVVLSTIVTGLWIGATMTYLT